MHGLRRKLSHFFFQAALVKSPDLLQEDDGVLGKAAAVGIQLNVSGELCLVRVKQGIFGCIPGKIRD